jgi:hypothetical protein
MFSSPGGDGKELGVRGKNSGRFQAAAASLDRSTAARYERFAANSG